MSLKLTPAMLESKSSPYLERALNADEPSITQMSDMLGMVGSEGHRNRGILHTGFLTVKVCILVKFCLVDESVQMACGESAADQVETIALVSRVRYDNLTVWSTTRDRGVFGNGR